MTRLSSDGRGRQAPVQADQMVDATIPVVRIISQDGSRRVRPHSSRSEKGRVQSLHPFPEVARFDAALRWIVKRLRLLVDAADEHIHAWEVFLRAPAEESTLGRLQGERVRSLGTSWSLGEPGQGSLTTKTVAGDARETFEYRPRRRHGLSAAQFDQRLHVLADDFEGVFTHDSSVGTGKR